MDVTLLFNDYLTAKGAKPVLQEPFEVSKLNGFMNDAYRINALLNDLVRYLRVIRSPYLALQVHRNRSKGLSNPTKADHVQPFTEQQRKDVDEALKKQLKQIDISLEQLAKDAEMDLEVKYAIRAKKQERKGFGRLGRWAAGGGALEKSPEELEEDAKFETEKAHRDGVIFSLRMRLQQAGKVQESIASTRLSREIEHSQNILSRSRSDRFQAEFPTASASSTGQPMTALEIDLEAEQASRQEREQIRKDLESQMTPAQLQQLQSEETTMLRHYNAELAKIQRAQASVLEISNLQTELTMHLNLQAEGISQLVSDSFEIGSNVAEGNRQLEKANERFRPAQWAFYVAVGTGAFLVLWDAIF
ncbi:uncharacterized protein PV09_06945 [Verruconis gallopava]|uniref:t-SNARE coiled-coil homology domain-containing protein n=1 Tax=Verruconis gallopava TaxID=253628 RepID=A0A0D2A4R1_9PEZI|nr:uncharacterized protein PV09_06945 [Verruconis gallopava]KIW01773.1 hypothetical protein PV09_06945 [Verruconis gallopava]